MDDFKKLASDRWDWIEDSPGHGMNGNPKGLKRIRRQQGRARLKRADRELFIYYWDDRCAPLEWRDWDYGVDDGWTEDEPDGLDGVVIEVIRDDRYAFRSRWWELVRQGPEVVLRGPFGPWDPPDRETPWVLTDCHDYDAYYGSAYY